MKVNYKNCEIECYRERESGCLYYSIFDEEDGYEVVSGFYETEDSVRDYIETLKYVVDDYFEHPEYYMDDYEEDEIFEETNDTDDEETYRITPKGIACLSLLQCGLVTDMNDPRIEGFWTLFENGMRTSGYIKEEDD